MTNIPISVLLQKAIQEAFQTLFKLQLPEEELNIQPTRKEFEGTHTLTTFSIAQKCQQSPEKVATQIGEWLKQHSNLIESFNRPA